MQTIQLKNYEDRVNKNQKVYLVIKDNEDTTFMCTDPRLFDIIKGSIVINAEVATEVNGNATFRKVVTAETVQAGPLPKADPKPRWTGGNGGGNSGGGGGGGFKADPYKQALIIRQNVLDRGLEVAKATMEAGHLDQKEGETVAHALVTLGLSVAATLEEWVRKAVPVVDPTAPVAAPVAPAPVAAAPMPMSAPIAPQAPVAPVAPVAPAAPGSEFEGGLPF